MIQQMLAIWSLVPLPFLKPAWTSESLWFMYCWSLAWRILWIMLLTCDMSAIVQYFEHSLALPCFGIGMNTDLFQSCGHCWSFQICWHIVCNTFTASSFRIWNSLTGIPSPPLALFIVMLPKAHLTSNSRMSGSRWVITLLQLSGPLRPFLQFCVFLPPLNIFCFCQVHTISVLYCAHLCKKCSHGIFNFLEEISSLSHSIVFLCSDHSGRLSYLSPCYSLELCIQMGISFFFSKAFCFSSQLFVRPPQTTFLHFFFLGMVLIAASCTVSRTSVHSSSGTLVSQI